MEIIRMIINSLNLIEVKGADNLDRLLSCIQGLERFYAAMEEVKNGDNNEQKKEVPAQMD